MRKGATVLPCAPAFPLAYLNHHEAPLSNKQLKVNGQQRPTDEGKNASLNEGEHGKRRGHFHADQWEAGKQEGKAWQP